MIIFRADGNPYIGSGHIMRCLSIADAGSECGFQCVFITVGDKFRTVITSHGHENIILYSDYRDMSKEIMMMNKIIKDIMPSALFVDSYYVSYTYLSDMKKICEEIGCKLVYIDDILRFPYPCDILLNYNIYGTDNKKKYKQMYQKAKKKAPVLLLGTFYAPLRNEFQNIPERIVRECATDILISTGGADPEHVSRKIAKYIAMNSEEFVDFRFYFIIGAMNPDKDNIESITRGIENITLYYNLKSISGLMQSCDLAISAAGSTLYELCATQTPAITYILADNQILGAEGFEKREIIQCVGDARELKCFLPEKLMNAMRALAGEYEERAKMSQLQRNIVDGRGAYRVIERLKY